MSVTDSRIKTLKACLLKFYELQFDRIDDHHPELSNLFRTLEDIFRFGLRNVPSFFGSTKCDFWFWADKLDKCEKEFNYKLEYALSMSIHNTRNSRRVKTDQGRGRLLLRDLVQNKKLQNLIKFLSENPKFVSRYYEDCFSIFTNDILMQILHSLVCELGRLNFNLILANADFLDYSWELPTLIMHEFVPCRSLGLLVQFLSSHFVITKIKETSVVLDDNLIEPGDVVTALHGRPLRGTFVDLKSFLAARGNSPIPIEVAKVRLPNGTLFQPIVQILEKHDYSTIVVSLDKNAVKKPSTRWPSSESLDSSSDDCEQSYPSLERSQIFSNIMPNESDRRSPSTEPLHHKLRYVGQRVGGSDGSIAFVHSSIVEVIAENPNPKKYLPVVLKTGELDLTIQLLDRKSHETVSSDEPFLHHSFPQISSVGRRKDKLRYVGYTAGETTCNFAESFICHVFLCMDESVALEFISVISAGFKRTHWTM